jgi:tetratricopeptide (TPR) repeat protein
MLKKLVFTLILLLIPVLLILTLEGGLRLAGVGESYQLLIADGENWRLNPRVAGRYFSQRDIALPEPIEQIIPMQKAAGTTRILCLGGSTTAGFPYEINISFPFFLKMMLGETYPDQRFEIINLGISAVNSHTMRDLLPEMLQLNPDRVLIYMGHNEFYGALGVASSEFTSLSRPVVRTLIYFRQWRIYQLLRSLINLFRPAPEMQRTNLMKALVAEQSVALDSPVYRATLDNFRANLSDILALLKEKNIPVIVSTLASNLRDQVPLSDNRTALTAFQTGESLLAQNDNTAAAASFIEARDRDETRFRAPSAMNTIIRETAAEFSVPVAETEQAFNSAARYGIPGNDLFLEHLHPNTFGYYLIAGSFFRVMNPAVSAIRFEHIAGLAGFTPLDQLIGLLKIQALTSEYPLQGKTRFRMPPNPDSTSLRIAGLHNRKKLFWDESHYRLGDIYLERGLDRTAEGEYRAVLIATPDNPTPYYKLAKIFTGRNDLPRAEQFLRLAIERFPDGHFLLAKLGTILIGMKRFTEARKTFENLFEQEAGLKKLNQQENYQAQFLYAVACAQSGDTGRAKEVLLVLQKQNPTDQRAADLLQQIIAHEINTRGIQ